MKKIKNFKIIGIEALTSNQAGKTSEVDIFTAADKIWNLKMQFVLVEPLHIHGSD